MNYTESTSTNADRVNWRLETRDSSQIVIFIFLSKIAKLRNFFLSFKIKFLGGYDVCMLKER